MRAFIDFQRDLTDILLEIKIDLAYNSLKTWNFGVFYEVLTIHPIP